MGSVGVLLGRGKMEKKNIYLYTITNIYYRYTKYKVIRFVSLFILIV